MCLKTVKTHVLLTRDAAIRVATELRNECKPCSDPYVAHNKIVPSHKYYRVDQYVSTEYPEM